MYVINLNNNEFIGYSSANMVGILTVFSKIRYKHFILLPLLKGYIYIF